VAEEIKEPDAQVLDSDEGNELEDDSDEPNVPISELRKVRAEAAKYRKRLRHLENKMEEEKRNVELAKMEETDRLKAVAAEAEARVEKLRKRADIIAKRAAVINAASALGFHNPEDAASIVDLSEMTIDDDGNVNDEKVSDLVKTLANNKPYLLKTMPDDQDIADFGPTNPASGKFPRPKSRLGDQIDQMKIKAKEAMKGGRISTAVKLYNQAWEKERDIKKKEERGG
jgi:hypothetical protein